MDQRSCSGADHADVVGIEACCDSGALDLGLDPGHFVVVLVPQPAAEGAEPTVAIRGEGETGVTQDDVDPGSPLGRPPEQPGDRR